MLKKYKIKLSPHNNLDAKSLCLLGFIIFSLFFLFSIVSISLGAWPISIFMGTEYLAICWLLFYFFKKRNVSEDIKINHKNITYSFYEQKKLKVHITLSSYWVKIVFWKIDNNSMLVLKESGKKIEIGTFLSVKSKELVFKKLKNNLNSFK